MGGSSKFIHASFPLVDVRCVVHVFVCSVILPDQKIFSNGIYVFVLPKRSEKKRRGCYEYSQEACWEIPARQSEIKLSKTSQDNLTTGRPLVFDKWTLTLSVAGHVRQIHIIIRCDHWLAVHRPHIDQMAQSCSSIQQSQTVTPGTYRWESTALRIRRSAAFGTARFLP